MAEDIKINLEKSPDYVIKLNKQGPAGPQGEQGIQGERGIQGPKGDKGDIGPSGTITVGDVVMEGDQVIITNGGTPEDAILDFTFPDYNASPDAMLLSVDQEVPSHKTFLEDQGIKSPSLDIRTDRSKRGNGLIFADKNGTQTAGIGPYVNNNGSPECRLIASNGTVSAFAGLGTTKEGQGFFEIPEPADTSDNNDAVTSAWVNRKLANLPKGNYGIKGDYSSKFGIIKAPTPIIDTKVGSKEITVKAGMMFIAPEDEAIVTVGTDIKYTIQATDKTTLFIADGYVLEAEDVYYQEQEPTDGTHTYIAWYNPKEGPQGTWKFKSNDTGNVWRSAKATPIADVLVAGDNITRIDYIGYVVLNGFTEGGTGSGHMVGELVPFPISIKFTPEGFIKPDGTEFTQGLFPDLWEFYLHPITIGTEQVTVLDVCTYEEYSNEVNTCGACAKWAVDDVRKTFKVPLMPAGYYLKNGDGTVNKAGLPNITGSVNNLYGDNGLIVPTGAFRVNIQQGVAFSMGTGGRQRNVDISYAASNSNPIYGASDTVETNAVAVQWFIYVANAQIGQSAIDWSRFETAVASKVDLLTASRAGMPSDKYTDLVFGANGTQYTAPSNGIFFVRTAVQPFGWISLQTKTMSPIYQGTVQGQPSISCYIPVKQGEVVTLYSNLAINSDRVFRFIYAEGSK